MLNFDEARFLRIQSGAVALARPIDEAVGRVLKAGKEYIFFLGTQFQVDYVDLLGVTHRALCNSGFFQGVEWLDDDVVITQ